MSYRFQVLKLCAFLFALHFHLNMTSCYCFSFVFMISYLLFCHALSVFFFFTFDILILVGHEEKFRCLWLGFFQQCSSYFVCSFICILLNLYVIKVVCDHRCISMVLSTTKTFCKCLCKIYYQLHRLFLASLLDLFGVFFYLV